MARRMVPRRRSAIEIEIERRIAAGADPEDFVCIDCLCWSLDPALCACWEREMFPGEEPSG